jgi:protein TonB
MNPAPDRQPLLRFVAASVLLHLLAAGAWQYGHPPAAPARAPQVLAIQLQAARPAAPGAHTADPRRAAGSAEPVRPAPARHAQPAAQVPSPALTTAAAATPRHATIIREPRDQPAQDTVAAVREPSAEARVRAAVHAAFRARFEYPRRARLKGWQGTVVIALRILPDGGVRNVRIADSSGIDVLDRAALRSLQDLRVPQAVAWMAGREMDMIIPVEYRLTGS